MDELEIQKRTNPYLRELHHDVGDYLDSMNGTMNRIGQIIKLTSLDFQYFTDEEKESMNIVVCDVREKKEARRVFERWLDWYLSIKKNF